MYHLESCGCEQQGTAGCCRGAHGIPAGLGKIDLVPGAVCSDAGLARIIAVADSYDAMTSNRSYRSYMPQEKVRAEIEQHLGTQFDPKIAQKMLEIIDADTAYTLHE